MKIKKIKQPQLKNKGFSLVELTVTLAVFGVIVLITTQIIEQVNVKKNINIQKEHITAYENSVIKKINANYDDLYLLAESAPNKQLVYTYANFNDYAKNGANSMEDQLNKSFFNPCILIKADTTRNTLSATLIYPANKTNLKNVAALSNELGNASWISNKDLIGKVKTDYFSAQNIQALAGSCNSNINSFKDGSIFIDLNNNNNLISKKSNITDNSTNNGTNETLKNNGDSNSYNKSIGTNLYLDAIVKESTPWSNYYCDPAQAETVYQNDIKTNCENFINQNNNNGGTPMYSNSAYKITSGYLNGTNRCTYKISGLMTQAIGNWASSLYNYSDAINVGNNYFSSCRGQNLKPAQQTCNIPYANAIGLYPNYACNTANIYQCNTINESGVVNGSYDRWACNEDIAFNDSLSRACTLRQTVRNDYSHSGACNTFDLSYNGYNVYWSGTWFCRLQGAVAEYSGCGELTTNAFIESGITPPQHKFKSLVLLSHETSGSSDRTRMNVLVKSGTADGTSTESDTYLNVQKAGVKSGYVLLKSKGIQADSACKSSELGKMIQQQNESSNYTTSQLVCSYDLDFCGGSGYCYTPLVSQSQFVDKPNSYSISCPAGLRADTGWSPTVANGGLSYDKCYSGTTPLNVTISQLKSGNKVTGLATICPTGGNGTPLNYLNRIKCVSSASEKILTGCKGGDNATCQ